MYHGSKISRYAPRVSHLLFTDDASLVFQANIEECNVAKDIIQAYKTASTQAVNFAKLSTFLSANVSVKVRVEMCRLLEASEMERDCKYLGMSLAIGRKKKKAFEYVKERL